MVLEGQYLERPTLIARRSATEDDTGLTLEGLYHRGRRAPAVLMCAPHPRLGGSMDSPVVAELAWAFSRHGHASLRFNYQGVGASEGELVTRAPSELPPGPQDFAVIESEIEDALAAARHLAECVDHGRVAIAGYSFGAAVALAAALREPLITHLILIAPPTRLFTFDALPRFTRPVLVAAGQLDDYVNRIAMSALVAATQDARFEVVPGATHAFARGLTDLGRLTAEWIGQR